MTSSYLDTPPYDVIIWMALFGLSLLIGLPVMLCCCRGPGDNRTNDEKETIKPSWLYVALRVVRYILVVFGVTYVATVIIVAIAGAAGLMEASFFTPTSADGCGGDCPFSTINGLEGWTPKECCSYTQNSSQRDVWIRTSESNYVINGWIMVNNTPAFAGQPREAVLYNHGSGGNIAMGYRHERYNWLLEQGNIAIFTYDYPGYGKSTSVDTITSKAVVEAARAGAVWFTEWVRNGWDMSSPSYGSQAAPIPVQSAADGSTDMSNVTLMGHSMGGLVSCYLGARTATWRTGALILQSTLSSLGDLWEDYFPVAGWVLHSESLTRFPEFDNVRHLSNYAGCLYLSHSDTDEWVPISEARALYKSDPFKNPNCSEFVDEGDAKHTQPMTFIGKQTLERWLAEARTALPAHAAGPMAGPEEYTDIVAGPTVAVVFTALASAAIFIGLGVLLARIAPKSLEPHGSSSLVPHGPILSADQATKPQYTAGPL
jgi:pimeloyl-ACP methyl ester carboxylesterase